MTTSRDAPNPLRPYYRPPSIGLPHDVPETTSPGTHGLGLKNGSAASYASSARDIFSDIDYTDYLSESSPSAFESARRQIDEWFYRYLSILLAQPFDVAKTILQVHSQAVEVKDVEQPLAHELRPKRSSRRESMYIDYPSDESDPDEPAYFTSSAPSATSYSPSRRRRQRSSQEYSPPPRSPPAPPFQLVLKRSDSIMEVISQEWTKEGAWGVWKGSNSTFVYGIMLQTLERWSRGFFSAIMNVPITGLTGELGASAELAGSPYPWASLGVAIAAAVTAGVILAPLDLIRTKLILTPISIPKRSLTNQLRTLKSYLCSPTLLLPTVLHSVVTPTISHSAPLLLRSQLSIDPVLTPTAYQFAILVSRSAELFIKLPLETVLRRAQMAVLEQENPITRDIGNCQGKLDTVVNVGNYRGVFGTMWWIVREEGVRETPLNKNKKGKGHGTDMRGQGLPGLWRGWRVGMWGLAGVWASKALNGGGGNGGEF